jgi:hypothetical protein
MIQPKSLETRLLIDPVVSYAKEVFVVEKSASNSQSFPIISNNYSTSSTSFTINPNSAQAVVDRLFVLQQPLELELSVTTPLASSILIPNQWGFRSMPLNSMISNITLSIGNVSVSQNTSDVVNALECVLNKDDKKYLELGSSLTMRDAYKYYGQGMNSSRNPFNQYSSSGIDCEFTRGSWPCTLTTSSTADRNIKIGTTLYEPLLLSPLINSLKKRVSGFSHLTQIKIDIQWCSDYARMFSIFNSNLNPVSNPLVGRLVWFQPLINVTQYNDNLMVPRSVAAFNYNGVERYGTDFNLPNNSNPTIVTSATIQLSSIPKLMFLYAQPNFNSLIPQMSRHFCPISNVTINFNNVTYLASSNQHDLYRRSVSNGLQCNFEQFSGLALDNNRLVPTCGSPVVLSFGKDVPLPNSFAPSVNTKCNLSVNITVTNNTYLGGEYPVQSGINTQNYTYFIGLVYDSSISLFDTNNGVINQSCLSELNVLQAMKQDKKVQVEVEDPIFGSGGFNTSGKYSDDMSGCGVAVKDEQYVGQGMTGGKKLSKKMLLLE